jgi:putative DNA primase/helicase
MRRIVATYDYRDEKGQLLYQNCRYVPKHFCQRRPDGNGGWIWNLDGVRHVLYKLPELLAASKQDWILFVEGEKDVENVRELGFPATTSGGADTWRPEFAEHFMGRLVAMVGDNDDAGRKYAETVCKSLIAVVAEIRVVTLPDGVKDISEWIEGRDSMDAQDLREGITAMIDAAKPVLPAGLSEDREPDTDGPAVLAVTRLADVQPREVVWFWQNRFVDWAFNVLSGDPGVSKSFLTIYMASVISRGACWPDCPDTPVLKGSVLLCSSEDEPGIIRRRLDVNKADPDRVLICSGVRVGESHRGLDLNYHLEALERFLDDVPDTRLVALDPVTAYLGQTNANSNAEVRATLGPLADLAARRKVTIIGINHHNKRQDLSYMYRGLGSTGFVAQARSVWAVIEDKDDPETRILAPIKANYSIRPTGLKYRIIDGTVAFEKEPWTGRLDDQLWTQGNKKRVSECADWLRERLSKGPVLATTLFDEAKQAGFSRELCYRAKKGKLPIRANKEGFGGQWFWRLSDEK